MDEQDIAGVRHSIISDDSFFLQGLKNHPLYQRNDILFINITNTCPLPCFPAGCVVLLYITSIKIQREVLSALTEYNYRILIMLKTIISVNCYHGLFPWVLSEKLSPDDLIQCLFRARTFALMRRYMPVQSVYVFSRIIKGYSVSSLSRQLGLSEKSIYNLTRKVKTGFNLWGNSAFTALSCSNILLICRTSSVVVPGGISDVRNYIYQ